MMVLILVAIGAAVGFMALCGVSLYHHRELIRGMWDAEMESVQEYKRGKRGN
jgi:hypothetical protein